MMSQFLRSFDCQFDFDNSNCQFGVNRFDWPFVNCIDRPFHDCSLSLADYLSSRSVLAAQSLFSVLFRHNMIIFIPWPSSSSSHIPCYPAGRWCYYTDIVTIRTFLFELMILGKLKTVWEFIGCWFNIVGITFCIIMLTIKVTVLLLWNLRPQTNVPLDQRQASANVKWAFWPAGDLFWPAGDLGSYIFLRWPHPLFALLAKTKIPLTYWGDQGYTLTYRPNQGRNHAIEIIRKVFFCQCYLHDMSDWSFILPPLSRWSGLLECTRFRPHLCR